MNRAFISFPAALLMSAGLMFVTAVPAAAATGGACTADSAPIRQAALAAGAGTARRALGHVATAEKLCAAGSERAANEKFAAAMRALGLPELKQLAAR